MVEKIALAERRRRDRKADGDGESTVSVGRRRHLQAELRKLFGGK